MMQADTAVTEETLSSLQTDIILFQQKLYLQWVSHIPHTHIHYVTQHLTGQSFMFKITSLLAFGSCYLVCYIFGSCFDLNG